MQYGILLNSKQHPCLCVTRSSYNAESKPGWQGRSGEWMAITRSTIFRIKRSRGRLNRSGNNAIRTANQRISSWKRTKIPDTKMSSPQPTVRFSGGMTSFLNHWLSKLVARGIYIDGWLFLSSSSFFSTLYEAINPNPPPMARRAK